MDSYKLFLLSAFSYRFCWGLMTTVSMVYMVTVAGLDPLQMVLVGTVLELSAFFFEIPTGVVADTYSRKLSMIIGYITVGLGYMMLAFFPSFALILLSQVIWGVGSTFLSGASQAWISDEIGEERANQSFITASQVGKIGLLLGIGSCVVLAIIDIRLPIFLGSLGLVLFGVFCIFAMNEKPFAPASEDERETWSEMGQTLSCGIAEVKTHPVIWIILIIALFEGMFSEGYDRLFAPFLVESYVFPDIFGIDSIAWWGLMSAGATLLSFFFLDIVRRFVKTSHYQHLVLALTLASFGLVAFMMMFAFSANFYMALAAYLGVAVMRSVKSPLSNAWLNQNLNPASRATIFSMQTQADALGQVGGGPVVGLIGKLYTIKLALITTTIALVPAIFLYNKALGLNPRTEKSAAEKAD